MKNKRICKTLSALCLTMVVAFGFTIPAFAQGSEQAPVAPAEDSTNDSNVIVEEAEPAQPPLLWLRELWKALRRYLSPGNVPMAQREEEPSWLNINW